MTEQKRGRPENNDNEVLTAIINNEDKRKEFVEAIENLVYHLLLILFAHLSLYLYLL